MQKLVRSFFFVAMLSCVPLSGMQNMPDDPEFWRTDFSKHMDLLYQIGERIRKQREEVELERVRNDPVLRQKLLPAVPTLLDPVHPTTAAHFPVWVKWIYLAARRSIR